MFQYSNCIGGMCYCSGLGQTNCVSILQLYRWNKKAQDKLNKIPKSFNTPIVSVESEDMNIDIKNISLFQYSNCIGGITIS